VRFVFSLPFSTDTRPDSAAAPAPAAQTKQTEAPDATPGPPTLRGTLLALAGSVALASLYGWQALANLTSGVVGGDIDGYENVWNFWWVKTALLDLHRNPYFTDYIYYPTGVSLRYHTLNPLNGLLTLPFNLTLGYVPTINLLLVAALAATTFCAFLFLRDLAGNPYAAFAGAALFTYANRNTVFFFVNGQTNLISLYWLPLYLFFTLRALHGRPLWTAGFGRAAAGSSRWTAYAAGTVIALVAMSLTDWQYVMFAVFVTLLYFTFLLVTRLPAGEKTAAFLKLVAIGGAYTAIVTLPLLLPMLNEMGANPWLIVSGQSAWHSLDLADLTLPGLGNPGYLAAAAAVLGLAAAWKMGGMARRSALFWTLIALIFYVMALGPVLILGGTETGVPLPYRILQSLPLFSIGRDPGRFSLVATLGVSVLCAFGLAWLLDTFRSRFEGVSRAALSTALAAAFIAVSVSGFVARAWADSRPDPPDFPAFYREIAADHDNYALLELPLFTEEGRGENHYMFYQVLHQKPRFSGRWARDHSLDNPNNFVKTTPLLRDLWLAAQPEARRDQFYPPQDIVPSPDYSAVGAPLLNLLDVRYVVLYKDAISPDLQQQYDPLLSAVLGPGAAPYRDEPIVTVYRVPERPIPSTPFALAIGNGWYPAAANPAGRVYRWADNATLTPGTNEPASPRSEIYIANASPQPVRAALRFTPYSFAVPRTLVARLDTDEIARNDLNPAAPEREIVADVTVPPGSHTLTFESPQPAQPTGDPNDARRLTFGVYGVTLEPAP
jgi:hypothetical protein